MALCSICLKRDCACRYGRAGARTLADLHRDALAARAQQEAECRALAAACATETAQNRTRHIVGCSKDRARVVAELYAAKCARDAAITDAWLSTDQTLHALALAFDTDGGDVSRAIRREVVRRGCDLMTAPRLLRTHLREAYLARDAEHAA